MATSARAERAHGRLRIFFGAVDGVGKTRAMLEAAHRAAAEGRDVVIGVIETPDDAPIPELSRGLGSLWVRREGTFRGDAFDLAEAIRGRPDVIVMDELAHVNDGGSLHTARWQDVTDLLDAGIDVFTTANVLDVESLTDVIRRIAHVQVTSPVPDAVLQSAEAIEVVDLPPEDALRLWRDSDEEPGTPGKRPGRLDRRGTLLALRQLTLQYAAAHAERVWTEYRRRHDAEYARAGGERLLVGVGPAPSSRQVVRAAKRMADRLRVGWVAVFVETPEYAAWSRSDRERVWDTLRLARELGAETATITGSGTSMLLEYARRHNLTRLVVGKPARRRWQDRLAGSRIEDVLHRSGDLDVYVIAADEPVCGEARPLPPSLPRPQDYGLTFGAVAVATLIATGLRGHLAVSNLMMLYLVAVVGVAAALGRGPAVLASILSVAAFDWFCIPPYGSFDVHDAQYFIVFATMLAVALFISTLTTRLGRQAELALRREERTNSLFGMTRDLLSLEDPARIAAVAEQHVSSTFGVPARVLAPDASGSVRDRAGVGAVDPAACAWAIEHARPAGCGTATLPGSPAVYLPVRVGTETPMAVIEFDPAAADVFRDPERLELAETLAGQTASAMERARLTDVSRRAEHLAELNRLKDRFVAVAAHELRGPLTSLGMAVELIAEQGLAEPRLGSLIDGAVEDVHRLRSLVNDLLDLSRLQERAFPLDAERVDPARLVEHVIRAIGLRTCASSPTVRSEVPTGIAPVRADASQVERALRNLLENAIRHAGPGGRVVVSADEMADQIQFTVADSGPGLGVADQKRVFEPFVQVEHGAGAGLGLAIVRGIVRAHGGQIWVDSGPGPGAAFSFTLPRADRVNADDRGRTPGGIDQG